MPQPVCGRARVRLLGCLPLTVLLLLHLLPHPALGIVHEVDELLTQRVTRAGLSSLDGSLLGFGLVAGGQFEIDLTFENQVSTGQLTENTVHVFVLNLEQQDQQSALFDNLNTQDTVATGENIDAIKEYELVLHSGAGSSAKSLYVANLTVLTRTDRYYMWFKTSNTAGDIRVQGRITLIQPNGSHLSFEERYTEQILTVSVIFWTIGMLLYTAGLIYYRWKYPIIPPYFFIMAALSFKVISVGASRSLYMEFDRDGRSDPDFLLFRSITSDLYEIFGLISLSLLSFGWRIIRPILTFKEWRMFASSMCAYVFVCFLSQVCSITGGTWCYFSTLLKFLARVFIFFGILVLINFTIQTIRESISLVSLSRAKFRQAIFEKYLIYKRNRLLTMSLFIAAPGAIYLASFAVLSWRESWVLLIAMDVIMQPLIVGALVYGWLPQAVAPFADQDNSGGGAAGGGLAGGRIRSRNNPRSHS